MLLRSWSVTHKERALQVVLTQPGQQEFNDEVEEGDKSEGEREPTPFDGLGLGGLFGAKPAAPEKQVQRSRTVSKIWVQGQGRLTVGGAISVLGKEAGCERTWYAA